MLRRQVTVSLLFLTVICTCAGAQTFSDSSQMLSPLFNSTKWGASAADFNNDGLLDIYHPGRLYLNLGENGFVDVLPTTGINEGANIFGAVFGDYDDDGYLDVLFEDFSAPSRLYRNKHNRTFHRTNSADNVNVHNLAQGAGWGDFNLDGRLDLFVNNDAGNNQLFRNMDYTSFSDISLSAGVPTPGNSYGMSWGDYNNDGFPDVFIATCSINPQNSIKHLLRNNGDETFTDVNYTAGVADSTASWGIVWLDYDNDGDFDVFFVNTQHPNPFQDGYDRLYRNNGNETFTDITDSAGVAGDTTDNGYGVARADFDNDGWIDIYVANHNSPHRLYRNNGDGTFSDITSAAGIVENKHRASAVADFNHDGWMDIFSAGNPQNRLMINNGGSNHWIVIKTRGVTSNHYGIGARVEVYADTLRQIREIRAGDSFCSQNDNLHAHFGLGAYTTIDSIFVRWPSGHIDIITNIPTDKYITVVEGLGITPTLKPFHLLAPANGDTLRSDSTIQLIWQRNPAGTGGSSPLLNHTVYFWGGSLDTIFSNIIDTTMLIDASFLQSNQTYNWMVDVSDGYAIVASREINSFVFLKDTSTVGLVKENIGEKPLQLRLKQNYPNPFNPQTTVEFELPKTDRVVINIFDIAGQKVITLADKTYQAGRHTLKWDGQNQLGKAAASGIYFIQMRTQYFVGTRRMVLLR